MIQLIFFSVAHPQLSDGQQLPTPLSQNAKASGIFSHQHHQILAKKSAIRSNLSLFSQQFVKLITIVHYLKVQ